MSGNDPHGLPGANAIGDTMEFVKNLWGSMKLPGMSMPSLSPEDIDKQIADLKAVESWLQMNMNLLRSTIQALEVQSSTLNALRSMGQSFANAANAAAAPPPPPPSSDKRPGFDSPFEPVYDRSARADDVPADTPTSGFQDTAAAQFANSAAWWNTVQEQFSNAVEQALTPVQKPAKKRAATKAASAAKTTSPRKRTPKA
jgi:hypothetical protein